MNNRGGERQRKFLGQGGGREKEEKEEKEKKELFFHRFKSMPTGQ